MNKVVVLKEACLESAKGIQDELLKENGHNSEVYLFVRM